MTEGRAMDLSEQDPIEALIEQIKQDRIETGLQLVGRGCDVDYVENYYPGTQLALAKIGIIALVDEATEYQNERFKDPDALLNLYRKYKEETPCPPSTPSA